jgi:hypothetical protein
MTSRGGAPDPGPEAAWRRFARHHAFIVGIDGYRHVSPLRTAVNDAQRLAALLAGQHRFEVHPPLLDATGTQLRVKGRSSFATPVCRTATCPGQARLPAQGRPDKGVDPGTPV